MRTPPPTPNASRPALPVPVPGAGRPGTAGPKGALPAGHGQGFRAVLAAAEGTRGGASGPLPAEPPVAGATRPARARDPRSGEERRDPDDASPPPPRLPPLDALREPGAASFGGPAPSPSASSPPAPVASSADPVALAAVAERVLRSLRVGTDAQGRSLVLLEVGTGAFAGCRVELRRVGAGVVVEVRGQDGAPDARARALVEALQRRGIEVL